LAHLSGANLLGRLVCVVTVLCLEGLDELDVLLLSLLGSGALIDDLLPRVVLGLALEVEHTGLGSLRDILAVGDLEKGCEMAALAKGSLKHGCLQ
jgi:hypothetical protein